jgi:hypothetical protein
LRLPEPNLNGPFPETTTYGTRLAVCRSSDQLAPPLNGGIESVGCAYSESATDPAGGGSWQGAVVVGRAQAARRTTACVTRGFTTTTYRNQEAGEPEKR